MKRTERTRIHAHSLALALAGAFSFGGTMDLDADAPLDQTALMAANLLRHQLPPLSAGQSITHLYLHWEVTGWMTCDSAYNGVISLDRTQNRWDATISTDPRLNATSPPQSGYAAHTYERNSHAFGLALAGMIDATPSNFGPAAINLHEVETLCAAAAVICQKYGIDASDPSLVMTHGEAAIHDGYFVTDSPSDGVTRWDLARLQGRNEPLSKEEAITTGDLLRARIHAYQVHG